MLLIIHHGHNVINDGLTGTLEACVSVTNLVKFKIYLVHEVLGVVGFTICNITNLVSGPLFPGLRLTDAGVGGDNVM